MLGSKSKLVISSKDPACGISTSIGVFIPAFLSSTPSLAYATEK